MKDIKNSKEEYDGKITRDMSNLVNHFVVFDPKENLFYKIGCIDYRNTRYEVWGARMSRWITFDNAIFIDFKNEEVFDYYYSLYESTNKHTRDFKTKEKIIEWLEKSELRITFLPDYLVHVEERRKFEDKHTAAISKRIDTKKNEWK